MTHNIPKELQELRQWVVADMTLNEHGEPSKAPLIPSNGKLASVTAAGTWGSFNEARSTGQPVGFVLAAGDPYTIIDLDDPFKRTDRTRIVEGDPDYEEACQRVRRHAKMMELFDSYTEISQSGQGMHIIVRGSVPAGRRRDKVEVYSCERYMITTGNVYHNVAIADRQELLDVLYAEMTTTQHTGDLADVDGLLSDEQVCQMAMNASNADKFNSLCRGGWDEMLNEHGGRLYESQSEADLALMTILAYYTRDNSQAIRLFRYSELGKREKALRDEYFIGPYGMLNKIRAKQPALVDLSKLAIPAPQPDPPPAPPTVHSETAVAPVAPLESEITFPPGVVGEIAEFAMRYNIRPMREAALATGIALVAGLVGRSYNVSSTGLNQYIIVLAQTGTGKEGISQSMDALVNRVRQQVPVVDHFIGPDEFGSGQGIIRYLDDHPCFVSVLGEFGVTLQQVSNSRASNAEVAIRKNLLKLYSRSGWHQTLRPTVYSDKDKNTKSIQAPCVTFVGESVPEEFFAGLSEDQIASGLIPRFLTLNYKGSRPPKNENAFCAVPDALVQKLVDLTTVAVTTAQNNSCAPVQMDTEGGATMKRFGLYVDEESVGTETELQIWNRAELKALKLAALVAVGCNPHAPVITKEVADWACSLVLTDVQQMLSKFKSGEVGRGFNQQHADVVEMFKAYLDMPPMKRRNYKAPAALWKLQIVPLAFMTTRVRNLKAFHSPQRTSRQLLEQILKEMVELEIITQLPLDQTLLTYHTKMPLYIQGPQWS